MNLLRRTTRSSFASGSLVRRSQRRPVISLCQLRGSGGDSRDLQEQARLRRPSSLDACSVFSSRHPSTAPFHQQHHQVRHIHNKRLPQGTLEQCAQFLIQDVPLGSMDEGLFQFGKGAVPKLASQRSLTMAEQLLDRLAQEVEVQSYQLTASLYSVIMRSWAKTRAPESIFQARRLLDVMESRANVQSSQGTARNRRHPEPDMSCYHSVLYACTICPHDEARSMAESIVKQMEEKARQQREATQRQLLPLLGDVATTAVIRPHTQTYNYLILTHANKADRQYGAATAAEDCLIALSKLGTTGGPRPNELSFNVVMKAWSISAEEKGADRALDILRLMERLDGLQPDAISFATVITAFGRRQRPEQAEQVFQEALQFFSDDNKEKSVYSSSVDLTHCFNAVCTAWIKSQSPDAPRRVMDLLKRLYSPTRQQWSPNIVIHPSEWTQTLGIKAHLQSDHKDRLVRADRVLRDMVDAYYRTHGNTPPPCSPAFNMVMHAWFHSKRSDSAERMQSLLDAMLELSEARRRSECVPTVQNFYLCIQAWAKSKHPDRLNKMIHLLAQMEARRLFHIDAYMIIIEHLCQRMNQNKAVIAADWLRRMEEQAQYHKFSLPSVSIGTYTIVIAALARDNTSASAERALQIFRRIPHELQPSSRTYASIINASRHLPGEQSWKLAVELYQELKELDANPKSKVVLDQVCFKCILPILAGANNPEAASHAGRVLSDMIELRRARRKGIEPSTGMYDSCLLRLTRSPDPAHLAQAVDLLKTIVDAYKMNSLKHLPSPKSFEAVRERCQTQTSEDSHANAESVADGRPSTRRTAPVW